jgi:alginate O-acetyltransferase complex protein AlgJ
MPQMDNRKIVHIAGIAMFLCALWTPAIGQYFLADWSPPLEEKRRLAALPELPKDIVRLGKYPRRFESWFNDHLGFRSSLIRWHNVFLLDVLQTSPAPSKVLIGKDGWYFLWNERIMSYYRRSEPFSENQLAEYCRFLESKRNWCKEIGAEFVYAIAPESMSLNKEYFPGWITPLQEESRLDQLVRYAGENSDASIIDLRGPVLGIKSRHQTHYKLDSHWTDPGALAGWQAIAESLRQSFPGIPVPSFDEYTVSVSNETPKEVPNLIPLPYALEEPVERLVPKHTERAWHAGYAPRLWERGYYNHSPEYVPMVFVSDDMSLPTAVIVGDSFGYAITAFAAKSFRALYYTPQCYFDPLLLKEIQPDVVIWLHTERPLTYINPRDNYMDMPSAELLAKSFVLNSSPDADARTPWVLTNNASFESWDANAPAQWGLERGAVSKSIDAFSGDTTLSLDASPEPVGTRIIQRVQIPGDFQGGRLDFRVAYLADSKKALQICVQWDAAERERYNALPDGRWYTWTFSHDLDEYAQGKTIEISFERPPAAEGRTLVDDAYLSIKHYEGIRESRSE